MAWRRLGLNLTEEWVEEDDHGRRRVQTPLGFDAEPAQADLRWCRMTGAPDALLVADGLSRANIFESFGSISRACATWSTKQNKITPDTFKAPPEFRALIEQAMAKRVWSSVVCNEWESSLPNWDASLLRKGFFDWPLGIDVGLWRRYGACSSAQTTDPHQAFVLWMRDKISKRQLTVSNQKIAHTTQIAILTSSGLWFVSGSDITQSADFDLSVWAGLAPKPAKEDLWNSRYVPFSSPQDVSGSVDPLLNQALQAARPDLSPAAVQEQLSLAMGISQQHLLERLSFDQIDAVWLAWKQLKQKKSFLLGDETGYGKGRVLAALAQIGLNSGHQVVFLTEKKALFSDFYRDVSAVFDSPIVPPVLMHPTAKVQTEDGASAISLKTQRRMVQKNDTWVWTTYSQFNRGGAEKLPLLLTWMKAKPTWVLLDEAQNAAGSSTTADVLKKIQKASSGVVFASATFAKNEDQLHAYRVLFDGTSTEWTRLVSAFHSNSNLLRTAITLMWAESGVFLRREHPPMPLPVPRWVEQKTQQKAEREFFANWWRSMYHGIKIWDKALGKTQSIWMQLGEPLSRAGREFALLQKKDAVVEFISQCKKNNTKAVLVSDWTLSSHLKEQWENSEDTSDKPSNIVQTFAAKPLWRDSWKTWVKEVLDETALSYIQPAQKTTLLQIRDHILSQLDLLPPWSASPFDDVILASRQMGMDVVEISGRQTELVEIDGVWVMKSRPAENRTESVRRFNNGSADVILLTRAGNSGISLHAGATFKDQRQRHLLEWDVSPDPSVRMQFWGRVRRKDQVMEPLRETLSIDTPSERRRMHRDLAKQARLTSHSGSAASSSEVGWIGPEGSFVAHEWIRENPRHQNMLGMFKEVSVEKMLMRSVLLPDDAEVNLINQLHRGVDLLAGWEEARTPVWQGSSRFVRSQWWWGLGLHKLTWRERVWAARPAASKEKVFDGLSLHASGQSRSAADVVAVWSQLWSTWFASTHSAKTAHRVNSLSWWQGQHAQWERGHGVSFRDPETGVRTRGIVLGWDAPTSLQPQDWSASQIGVWVWPVCATHPLRLSLAAWVSSSWGQAQALGRQASLSWFQEQTWPTHALVLEGPAWSSTAWGARNAPTGSLIHLKDDLGHWSWGWKMPASWGWEQMLSHDRELASVSHALAFWRTFSSSPIRWRWSAEEALTATPVEGGVMVTGQGGWVIEKFTFPITKRVGPVRWNETLQQWYCLIPWQHWSFVAVHWFADGALPNVSSSHAAWHQSTWNQYATAHSK